MSTGLGRSERKSFVRLDGRAKPYYSGEGSLIASGQVLSIGLRQPMKEVEADSLDGYGQLILRLGMQIASISIEEKIGVMNLVDEIGDGLRNLRSVINTFVDPTFHGLPDAMCSQGLKVIVDANIYDEDELKVLIKVDETEQGGTGKDFSSGADEGEWLSALSVYIRRIEKVGEGNDYDNINSTIVELLVAAYAELMYDLEDYCSYRPIGVPVGIVNERGQLTLGIKDVDHEAALFRAKIAVPSYDKAEAALSAFEATFRDADPERFVTEWYDCKIKKMGIKETARHLIGLGITPNSKAEFSYGNSRGNRKFMVSPRDPRGAALIIEQALDFVKPEWRCVEIIGPSPGNN